MKRTVVLPLLAMTLFAGIASAQPITYTETIFWPDCITANQVWASEATSFTWVVKQSNPGGLWTYQYTLDVPSREIDEWILELSPNITLDDLSAINWPLEDIEVGKFTPLDIPELPCDIYGIRFMDISSTQSFISFQTSISPTWGDFFALDGEIDTIPVITFNQSFCAPDPEEPPSDGTINCKILRPEGGITPPTVIPEPGSIVLAIMGLLPALAIKLKRVS